VKVTEVKPPEDVGVTEQSSNGVTELEAFDDNEFPTPLIAITVNV
jgi:hypothetical protein